MPFGRALKSISTIILACSCVLALAQEAPNQSSKSFAAVRTNQPPRIDGDLSDPAWENAARVETSCSLNHLSTKKLLS